MTERRRFVRRRLRAPRSARQRVGSRNTLQRTTRPRKLRDDRPRHARRAAFDGAEHAAASVERWCLASRRQSRFSRARSDDRPRRGGRARRSRRDGRTKHLRHRERSSVTKRTCAPPPSSRSENRDLVSPTPRGPALESIEGWFVDELRTRGERASSSAASPAARDSHAFCTHIATRSGTTVCDRHGSRDCLPVPKIFLVVCRPKPKRTERPGGSSARCRVFRSL